MKTYTKIGLLFATLLLLQLHYLNAQVKLSATNLTFQYGTTTFSAINTISYSIKNTGTTNFVGTLWVDYQTDFMTQKVLLDSVANVSLTAGDSINFIDTNFQISPSYFKKYNNIVVVWPRAVGVNSIDSAVTMLYVLDSITGVLESKRIENGYAIYPNPANSRIYVYSIDSKSEVENIRIYNSIGTLIKIDKCTNNQIDVSGLDSGLYLLEIETKDKHRIIKRFIRQ